MKLLEHTLKLLTNLKADQAETSFFGSIYVTIGLTTMIIIFVMYNILQSIVGF